VVVEKSPDHQVSVWRRCLL